MLISKASSLTANLAVVASPHSTSVGFKRGETVQFIAEAPPLNLMDYQSRRRQIILLLEFHHLVVTLQVSFHIVSSSDLAFDYRPAMMWSKSVWPLCKVSCRHSRSNAPDRRRDIVNGDHSTRLND